MSRRSHEPATTPTGLARSEAARLLRAARSAGGADREEKIDWAFAACPDRRHAARLKIASLLDGGHCDAALALIARGLLRRPADPALTTLRARGLLMQQAVEAAEREIQPVLEMRPQRAGALRLAARIAAARGDTASAALRLRRAARERPSDEIRAELAQALLDDGSVSAAAEVLASMDRPSPVLRSRLLAAEGRRLDAIEHVESALWASDDQSRTSALAVELIDLLEDAGAVPRLRRTLGAIDFADPEVLIRAGRSWLWLGEYGLAVTRLSALREAGRHRGAALSICVVAAAMLGRLRLAELALARLARTVAGSDPIAMADLWRRALRCRLLEGGGGSGPGRPTGMLGPLLEDAIGTLSNPGAGAAANLGRAELGRHRAVCLAAVGRLPEAAAAYGGSTVLGPAIVTSSGDSDPRCP